MLLDKESRDYIYKYSTNATLKLDSYRFFLLFLRFEIGYKYPAPGGGRAVFGQRPHILL